MRHNRPADRSASELWTGAGDGEESATNALPIFLDPQLTGPRSWADS